MDDFKRQIYMRVRELIAEDFSRHICTTLFEALNEIACTELKFSYTTADVMELLPEVGGISDGVYWDVDGGFMDYGLRHRLIVYSWFPLNKWGQSRRLQVLDHILGA